MVGDGIEEEQGEGAGDGEDDQHDRLGAGRVGGQVRDEQPAGVADLVLEGAAAQQRVERDEDRDLEDQRQAGRERVDAVLLEERHLLALHALAVVLVLLLDLLHVRLERLHLAHPVHRLEREGQDDQPGEPGDQDDSDAPGEADVVVQPVEDVVEEVDQRLEDVGFEEHDRGVLRQIGSAGCAAAGRPGFAVRSERVGVSRKSVRSESSSTPPWLKGLQRSRRQAGEDRAADRARARGSPERRSSSRSGSSGSAARSPGRSGAGRGGSARSAGRRATVSRQTLLARSR